MTSNRRRRSTALTRHMLGAYSQFSLLIWLGYLAFAAAVVVVVSFFRSIEISGWDQAATMGPRWYVLGAGAHLGYSILPVHLAHGQTRRAFAGQIAVFTAAFAAFCAALMAAGFVLEAGLYAVGGWPQVITLSHLFTSPWELHLVFAEFWLRFLVWGGAGFLLGAAFYRKQVLGGILIVPVIVLVSLAEIALAPRDWWPFGSAPPFLAFDLSDLPLLVSLVHPLLCAAALAALAWPVIKDIPLRNRTA